MKTIKALLILVILLISPLYKAQTHVPEKEGLVWYTDMIQANEVSKTSGKPLFAFFTGSDWCGWCIKLQNDVFSKPEFIAWAKKNVVLVELDFPRGKQLSPALAQQNASLQQTFQVRGFPTIWLFFMNKKEGVEGFTIESLGSLGYPQGAEVGREQLKFLSDANALLAKKIAK